MTYLVQVRQRVGVLAQSLVLPSQTVSGSYPPEPAQVHHVQSADMISPSLKMIAPVTLLPEPEPVHLGTTVAEWRVTVRSAAEIQVPEFFHVCSHNLSTIYDKYESIAKTPNLKVISATRIAFRVL